ncbi:MULTISPECIES: hypothetical protein [unclassified Tenacibaculum]|uniref:hypothetical protein n=1 Tax=unclassified Tenacibaculum TaxID=2635139 RepID=UPI001F4204CC|nr:MULTISPECIES: hypothetical protein [unclassified Tenacibaculum]MCF2875874.1 hypothetical protein [Tenacibaculum sp. Cn5-1]MCF2935949.1 hypothetical protein [Tenacibaculum sp. Cn5-34]MCG7512510.1 hypothetical protein [Tenacibaculum sp. Cn5-46]
MRIILLVLIMINTSCVSQQKKSLKAEKNKFNCKIDFNKITNSNYLKDKLNDFNSEDSDCLEAFFSQCKYIYQKKKENQEDYLSGITFLYDNSDSLSSTLIEGSFFNEVFQDNITLITDYLFNNKNSSLNKALKMGISYEYSIFEGKERDEKYNAIYKKVSNELKNERHKNYIIELLNDIDRDLYD